MKVSADGTVHFEHILLIRCDIEPRSVKRFRDVENSIISEKSNGYTLKALCSDQAIFIFGVKTAF
jgi:hypothetical protein